MTTLIKNGTLIAASDTFQSDILIEGELILEIGKDLTQPNAEVVDAAGKFILPGGIDPHVHLHYPQGPNQIVSSDDWLTGTMAAAFGGTTTVIDFVEAKPGESFLRAFEARLADAADAVIDFGFHMTFNRADDVARAEIPAVIAAGMPSFKIYMAYDNIRLNEREMLTALQTLKADDFDRNRDYIVRELEKEIAAKLFGTRAKVEATFDDDPCLAEAIKVLQNQERYLAILGATAKQKG